MDTFQVKCVWGNKSNARREKATQRANEIALLAVVMLHERTERFKVEAAHLVEIALLEGKEKLK